MMRDHSELATLWLDGPLGAVERACLRSALRQGHSLDLYCYGTPEGAPAGVTVREAAEIVPSEQIVRHKSGSPSLFTNLFRYELQRRSLGTWMDTDLYLLRPIDLQRPYLFAWESQLHINGAVLRLPGDSPLVGPLVEPFAERSVPSWLPWRDRLRATLRRGATGRTRLDQMPWGTAGPKALTAVIHAHGLERWALPIETFHPVHWERSDWILSPSIKLDDVIGPRTVAVHLWNSRVAAFKDRPAPPGSFLARLQDEGAG